MPIGKDTPHQSRQLCSFPTPPVLLLPVARGTGQFEFGMPRQARQLARRHPHCLMHARGIGRFEFGINLLTPTFAVLGHAKAPPNSPITFSDGSLLHNGWMTILEGLLLFWVPPDHRPGLFWPRTVAVIGTPPTRAWSALFMVHNGHCRAGNCWSCFVYLLPLYDDSSLYFAQTHLVFSRVLHTPREEINSDVPRSGTTNILYERRISYPFYTTTAPLPGMRGSLAASNFPSLYPIDAAMLKPGEVGCTLCPSEAR